MSEMEASAILKRAMVESHPIRITKVNSEPISVRVHVRFHGQNIIFPVEVSESDPHFGRLLTVRPGDEMFVSYDSEDIGNIIHNNPFKRLWNWLFW